MSWVILDEDKTRQLSAKKRLSRCTSILKTEKDPSKRWDAVWIIGELAREIGQGELYDQAADLLVWVLENDDDGVVKHEVCYQISACNMREKIPDLLKAGLNNTNPLARHEALECLGFMEAFETINDMKKALTDPIDYVRETAICAIKRLNRMKRRKGEFAQPQIL